MTELVVKLPDELAQRARRAWLLTASAMQRLLEGLILKHQAKQSVARAAARAAPAAVARKAAAKRAAHAGR